MSEGIPITEGTVGSTGLSRQEMRDLYAVAWRDVRDSDEGSPIAELNERFKGKCTKMDTVLASTFGKLAVDIESRGGSTT